ncbi:coronatine-insensitive protein homolog 1a-like [Phragmites australis]|uniref:coronatine-insensitive protein homolog 1a-like n=1 Tax=Phragmites australis TaxID=29695 RepID=UPI002D7743EA|nr:coronatine-insensitive protein homolog 1a-like [Phragmites australis]
MGGEVPEPLSRALSSGCGGVPEEALHLVFGYVDDPRDREAASLVCRRWHRIDALTRKHVTVGFCYAAEPARLRARFSRLESLALKGRPRASMYGLIPDDWGAYAAPWVAELAAPLECLKAVHLRRMTVTDDDIAVLVRARGRMLQELKLDKCCDFSTDALRLVARSCRSLRTLFLEECKITDNGSEWLHELAINNSVLVTLNFYMTELKVEPADLELLAKNCKSLISLKMSDCDLSDLIGFFHTSKGLQEFAGGAFSEVGEYTKTKYGKVKFPPRLCFLGLTYMGTNEMPVIFPFSATLKKLDLQYTFLTTEDHCQLISKCPNLLVLEVRNVIGDRGLEVVAGTCKKLRRLRIERGDDDPGQEEQGGVSQLGLTAVAVGCRELEYIAAYVSDITNGALESIGTFCKNLYDFRLVLLDREKEITDLPLDNGVRALLRNCTKLRRFAFYLRPGGLSDVGLGYIGQYSGNIQYMLLGNVGESDHGLIHFAIGCTNLRKLELRSCCFSERALALAVLRMPSLRYIWVQGYRASQTGRDLLLMARPFWNIEFVPPSPESTYQMTADGQPCVDSHAQVLGYYSLAGRRPDCPQWLVTLHPT